jgi:hypothetical protein
MANRYWVTGGTGDWSSTSNWSATSGGASGASVPTTADAVFFNANSGTGTATVNNVTVSALSLNCTGFTGTIIGAGGSSNISCVGNVTLNSTMFFGSGSLGLIITGTSTFISATKTANRVTVNSGAILTLGDAYAGNVSFDTVTVNAGGTLTTGNFNITVRDFLLSGTINLGSSTVNVAFWENSSGTVNAGTSNITASGTVNAPFISGTATYYRVTLSGTSASIIHNFNGSCTFDRLTFAGPVFAGTMEVSFSGNQIIGTLVASGPSPIRRIAFRSSVFGTARTLTVTTYTTKQHIDFQDITVAGTSSPWSGTGLGNCLGNTNITFPAAKTVYWNLTGAQSWMSAAWATTSGGAPSEANYPLAQDTAIFDNAGAAATTVTIPTSTNISGFNASARTVSMTLSGGADSQFYKDFISGSGVTLSLNSSIEFSGRSTQTITSAGGTFAAVTARSGSNTLSLGDAMNCTGALTLLTGADFNANTYSVTTGSFAASASSTINLGNASWTVTGSGTCWNVNTSTISGTAEITLSNNTTTARTFSAGTNTFGKLTIGGNTSISTTTITGTPTFSEIASTKTVAHTIIFPNVTTTVGNFTVRGSLGNLVTLSRTGASGTFTLAKSGAGLVNSDYLSISNSTASPINTWYAGANSTNGGGNTNWIFTAVPTLSGNFFNLF